MYNEKVTRDDNDKCQETITADAKYLVPRKMEKETPKL